MSATITTFPPKKLQSGHVRSDLDLTTEELRYVLDLTRQVKRNPGRFTTALSGRYLSLLFEKPSLRTRLTFELAIKQLGGDSVTVVGPIGDREPLKDVARNLDRWTNCIVARTFEQKTVDELAHWSNVPVVNALSDLFHPCQALADMATIDARFGRTEGLKLAFVGDGNNVAHSLMLCAARLGMHFAIATPKGYAPNRAIVGAARTFAEQTGASIVVTESPEEAVKGADAVYTDVWTSMGQESEAQQRVEVFEPYQLNGPLLAHASQRALVMHCLPAKRGQEITDEAVECPNSVVFDQAEYRLHAQKALLLMLVK